MYFDLFRSTTNNQWYWSFKADNHQIIATGGEGYTTKENALHGINLVKKNAAQSSIYDRSQEKWI